MPDRASGFCVYNDVAVGIRWLLDQGAERVAYVDVDVHHGDGVEQIFYDDPRVLTISPARDRPDAVPGHRLRRTTRRARTREGSAVNVALPPGTGGRRLAAGLPRRRARRWCASSRPTCWSPSTAATRTSSDPLAHLMLSVDGQRAAYLALHDLAHEVAGGTWVVTGGGGYALVEVVPRAWTHLLGDRRRARRSTRRPTTPEAWRGARRASCSAGPRRTG